MKRKLILLLLISGFITLQVFAQDPHYFTYDDENGMPSNEAYSMVQDERGFIWIGCDAGLYKFDGVRYIPYKCSTQKSKSVSGLTLSASGRLYCCNFQSQIFCLEKDSLRELDFPYSTILHMTCDYSGNLVVNHNEGFAVYNEFNKTWQNYTDFDDGDTSEIKTPTRSARVNKNDKTCFLTANGVAIYSRGELQFILPEQQIPHKFSSEYIVEWWHDEQWVFPFYGENTIYRSGPDFLVPVDNAALKEALSGKRITNVKYLPDDCLWICSYEGIIRFNPANGSVRMYYPDYSFSDCLVDREGSYWFTTLQSGILRVPNLEHLVWNKAGNNKISHVTTDGKNLFFSTINGEILCLDSSGNSLKTIYSGDKTDIQCLNYVAADRSTYFFSNKNLYAIDSTNTIRLRLEQVSPVKFICRVGDYHLLCSSSGASLYDLDRNHLIKKLTNQWSRQALYDANKKQVWIATNNGLLHFKTVNGNPELVKTFFENTQVLSMDFDEDEQQLYVLTFDGKMYAVDSDESFNLVGTLPADVQPHSVKKHRQKLIIATNKGLWIFSLAEKTFEKLGTSSGLASNHIQEVVILNNRAWLATGKGLQRIPVDDPKTSSLAKIYLRNPTFNSRVIDLDFGQPLVLFPEASIYNSNGNFFYAYRNLLADTNWTLLPSSIEQIELQNLPTGKFNIELKVIDHLGRDSENTISIIGYVNPPFWKTWWFISILVLFFFLLVFLLFRQQLSKRQKKLQQQNELNMLKLTAIRSQMNPHFIFNSLNSIQDLILKGDVEHSYSYITTFSDLVRLTLNYSDKELIDFEQELKLLELYLSLEKLRFKKDLVYTVEGTAIADIQVPPMLIQPFIENALVHGLLHKEGEKKLRIHFTLEDTLVCVIEDNGVGREKAAEIKKRQQKVHESFAVQAIQKRFDILRKHYPEELGCRYEDIFENGKAAGTRVILNIPFRHKY